MACKYFYEFGRYLIDPSQRVLLRDGVPVPVAPKAFETLLVLVESKGQVVERTRLIEHVWPDTFVEEQNLTFNISVLRKLFADSGEEAKFIETIPKRGYRFVPAIRMIESPPGRFQVETRTLTRLISEVQDVDVNEGVEEGVPDAELEEQTAIVPVDRSDSTIRISDISGRFVIDKRQVVPERQRSRILLVALILSIVLVGGVGLYLYERSNRKNSIIDPVAAFQSMKLDRLTTSGHVRATAISADGVYVVYVIDQSGEQSLWIRHGPSASNVQIVSPSKTHYSSVAFARDGNSVFYVQGLPNSYTSLFRIPVLGGTAAKITDRIDSRIALSPDGNYVAFARSKPDEGHDDLMVVNVNDGSERVAAVRTNPDYLSSGGPAWSPDGKTIAFSAGSSVTNEMAVFAVNTKGGPVSEIANRRWFRLEQMAWLADSKGLLFLATPDSRFFYQIWHLDVGERMARRLTNDLNNYYSLTLTNDSNTIVTVKFQQLSEIWLATLDSAEQAHDLRPAFSAPEAFCGGQGLAFTHQGKIVFTSNAEGEDNLWIVNQDGSDLKQLTKNARVNWQPSVSPDGSTIFLLSDRTGVPHIWTIEMDGSHPKQLTNGLGETGAIPSPDGKWIVYAGNDGAKYSIYKMDLASGSTNRISAGYAIRPAVSPDGKMIAYWENDDELPGNRWHIRVVSAEDNRVLNSFEMAETATARGFYSSFFFRVRFSSDSQSLLYIDNRNGGSGVWSIPVGGGPPKEVAHIDKRQVLDFNISPDGKLMALAAGTESSDVVMLTGLRSSGALIGK